MNPTLWNIVGVLLLLVLVVVILRAVLGAL